MENLINMESLENLKENLDKALSEVPANYLLGAGAVAWLLSSGLKHAGKAKAASFVEALSVPVLSIGLYYKMTEISRKKEVLAD
ncbi:MULTISPECIES: hypothetical protein [unclassified Flavobacterium]|uniref:hypothetical protein n=1 Tax=unclassified Flavobacterium TaxID=196869 RepID=UPI0015701B55|nr:MULTISPECIES: hypothetical protein [unclassified Flavobacterium]MBE0391886.1 hypothetical protein [Flavobacterium sp. PL002]NRT16329.1 hypothetical protein [Flavobacterium sp. 28A]